MMRNCVMPNERKYRRKDGYHFPIGHTGVVSEERTKVFNPFAGTSPPPARGGNKHSTRILG